MAVQMEKKIHTQITIVRTMEKLPLKPRKKLGLSQVIYIIILNMKNDDNSMNENTSE